MDALPDAVYRAVRDLDPDKVAQSVPLLRVLGRARAIPAALADRFRGDREPETLTAEEYQAAFVLLDERPSVVGRPAVRSGPPPADHRDPRGDDGSGSRNRFA